MINKLEMEQSLYPTLQLACCLMAIVAVAWLVMSYLTPKCSESEKKTNVHLYYLVGIGSLLLIGLVTYILTRDVDRSDDLLKYISFASTISSILLSFLAIIYAIVSGSKGESLYLRTEEVSKQIGDTLPKFEALDVVVRDLKKIPSDIENHLSIIKSQMQCLEDYSLKTYRKIDSMSGSPDGVINSDGGSPLSIPPGESAPNKASEDRLIVVADILRDYVSNSSYWGKLLLLACCYAKETNKPFLLTDSLFKEEAFPSDYLYGYLIASSALGVVASSIGEDGSWTISEVYNSDHFNLKKEALNGVKRQIKDDSKYREGRQKNLEDVQEYFGVK